MGIDSSDDSPGNVATAAKPPTSAWDLLRANLGTASAAALSIYLAFRILTVTEFDVATAQGVVIEGGTGSLLIATLVDAVRLLVTLLLMMAINAYFHPPNSKIGPIPLPQKSTLVPVILLLTSTAIAISPAFSLISCAVLALALAASIRYLVPRIKRRVKPGSDSKAALDASHQAYAFAVFMTLATSMVSSRPWMPAERIKPQAGASLTGYVVKSSPESTLVLQDDPRQLVRLDGKVNRSYCRVRKPSLWNESVPRLLSPRAKYPLCKDSNP